MAHKKFELVADQSIEVFGIKLFRIRALISFGSVSKGDLGGYIAKEENLSQNGNAWVRGNARVCGDAQVYGNAQVRGNAWVRGNARVCGDAQVCGNAWVRGNARVCGNAWVYGDARVCGNAWVYGDAQVCGDAWVRGNARVCGDASIFWASRVGSENGTLTVFRAKVGLYVTRGCFAGTDIEFLKRVDEVHGAESKIGREYHLLIEVARSRIDTSIAIPDSDDTREVA